jgi:hypothetical protein
MDPSSLAAALVGAQIGGTQISMAAKMMRMNADSEASIAQVIQAAQQNLASLANVAPGIGENVNISA